MCRVIQIIVDLFKEILIFIGTFLRAIEQNQIKNFAWHQKLT